MRDIRFRSLRRRRVAAAAGAVACTAAAAALVLAPSAQADSPTRSGWWNGASAGGSALPQPTTADGDLHVGNAPSGPTAIAAVFYRLLTTGPSSATLELKITPNSAVGTPAVMACPTTDTGWKEGGDQPWSEAPKYSCTKHANGIISADSTKLTFLLDGSLASAGALSLALVPAPGDTTPFSVDFTKPGFDSLMVTADASDPSQSSATSGDTGGLPPPGPPPASTASSSAGTDSSGGATAGPPLELPNAGTVAARSDAGGSAPVVAGAPGAATTASGLPAAPAAAATPDDQRSRNLAILLLLAMAVLLGRGSASLPRQPQPLGRRRWAGQAGEAAAAGAPVAAAVPVTVGGIGRFAKERTAPARPLI